jgi:non-ribosomal peptide synthetase component F
LKKTTDRPHLWVKPLKSQRKKIQRNLLECLLGPLWEALRRAIGDPDLPHWCDAWANIATAADHAHCAAPSVTLQ